MRSGEGAALVLSAVWGFLALGSWFVVRPARDTMGTVVGDDVVRWLYIGTLAGMAFVNPLYSWLVSKTRRVVFTTGVYGFFAMNLVGFRAALEARGVEGSQALAGVFFVWSSVFNLFILSVFWGFMADLWRSGQAKRVYGVIGLGGTLGAIGGSAIAATLSTRIGVENLLLVGAGGLVLAGCCAVALGRTRVARGDSTQRMRSEAPVGGGALDGLRTALASPYLLGISGYILLLTITQTFVYFQELRIVGEAFAGRPDEKTKAFASISFWTQTLTAVTQALLTARLLRWLGIGGALCVLPVVTLTGLLALAMAPSFMLLAVFQAVRKASDYALARPAREALYTVVSRSEKFKAKSFIDTFVYRGGDVVGAGADGLVKSLGGGTGVLVGLTTPLAAVWVALALWLGRQQRRRAEEEAARIGLNEEQRPGP